MHRPSLILHHYTSGDGLLGIFESDSIWATKIQYMNDSTEFTHAIELAQYILQEINEKSTDDNISLISDEISMLLSGKSSLAIYVACFSEVRDSLSQWRGYCPPSFGYSLGFDGDKLRKIAESQEFTLAHCIYEDSEQEKIIAEWVHITVDTLSTKYKKGADVKEFCRTNSGHLMANFVKIAPLLKNISFVDEREWRLVSLVPWTDARIKLRPGKSMLIPYVPIKLNMLSNESLLWEVVVGPTSNIGLAMDSVSKLHYKGKIINGIHRTRVPYRDW